MEPLGRLPDGRAKLRGTTLGLREEDWPRTRQQSPDRQARGRKEVAAGRTNSRSPHLRTGYLPDGRGMRRSRRSDLIAHAERARQTKKARRFPAGPIVIVSTYELGLDRRVLAVMPFVPDVLAVRDVALVIVFERSEHGVDRLAVDLLGYLLGVKRLGSLDPCRNDLEGRIGVERIAFRLVALLGELLDNGLRRRVGNRVRCEGHDE